MMNKIKKATVALAIGASMMGTVAPVVAHANMFDDFVVVENDFVEHDDNGWDVVDWNIHEEEEHVRTSGYTDAYFEDDDEVDEDDLSIFKDYEEITKEDYIFWDILMNHQIHDEDEDQNALA